MTHRLAVIGAGVMGTGIATLAVASGLPVVLVDLDESTLDRARAAVARQLRLARLMGTLPARTGSDGELATATDLACIAAATAVVEEGIATPDAVDVLFTACLGHRMGPLATADLIGIDNVVDSLTVLLDRTGDGGYLPCGRLRAMVRAGELGRKAGRGFFDYDQPYPRFGDG
jgi:methoxymalonate biosynthesis protein